MEVQVRYVINVLSKERKKNGSNQSSSSERMAEDTANRGVWWTAEIIPLIKHRREREV